MEIALIISGILNFALLGMLYLRDKTAQTERNQYITAILSKTPQEFAVANKIIEQKPPEPPKQPDFIPETELSDEDFFKTIEKNNK